MQQNGREKEFVSGRTGRLKQQIKELVRKWERLSTKIAGLEEDASYATRREEKDRLQHIIEQLVDERLQVGQQLTLLENQLPSNDNVTSIADYTESYPERKPPKVESMPLESLLQNVRQQIAETEIQSALDQLQQHLSTAEVELQNEVTLQQRRYKTLCDEERKGIITHETFQVELNRLSQNILDFLKKLAKQQTIEKDKLDSGIYIEDEKTKDDSLINQQDTMQGGHIMNSENMTDVVIVTALKKERKAVLKYLKNPQEIEVKGRKYYKASISTIDSSHFYQIVLLSLPEMGNIRAALATQRAIDVWNPAHIILAGIAGGNKEEETHYLSPYLGDVIVGEQIVYYELGKQTETGTERRNRVYRPAQILFEAAKNLEHKNWAMSIETPRPDGSTGRIIPRVHSGAVMSGDKVVADAKFMEEFQNDWSELIGIEMEGAGTATAAYESETVPGVLLVKGICDWANAEKDDRWQKYAAEASAVFIIELLKTNPFESKWRPQPSRRERKLTSYSGKIKLQVCRRLVNDWGDLADIFEIKPYHRGQFQRGREPQGVWEWLEQRNKLGGLENALKEIGREDLVELFHSE